MMHITESIQYIGVNDHATTLFEGQYSVLNGMSYNSYVILDDKIAVMDTVEKGFSEEWLSKLKEALHGRQPDYLIVQHMEPDHSANIAVFMQRYPEAMIVSSSKAFAMMQNFFGTQYDDRRIVVGEGDSLSLGTHELVFFAAPMVHWPEVIVTYERTEKVLFSADGFGKFGALDVQDTWTNEARRYYIGIVGKFGMQVQKLLQKAGTLKLEQICPLHGPVLKQPLAEYLQCYDTWSSYRPETKGVLIAYASVYGNTRKAAEQLAECLRTKGQDVTILDLTRCDMAEAVAQAFRYDKLVLASVTYNGDIFPAMKHFLHQLKERNFQQRTVGLMENGSWAPTAAKGMQNMLSDCRNLVILDPIVRIASVMRDTKEMEALAQALFDATE